MNLCGVVEVRNLADAVGLSCSNPAIEQCSDCDIEICDSHAESCSVCHAVFCPACLSLHRHQKAAAADLGPTRERKSA